MIIRMLWGNLLSMSILILTAAIPASAGDIKTHKPWPSKTLYTYQDVTTLDIVADLGFYFRFKDEKDIKVSQTSVNGSDPFLTYLGCTIMDVVTNFPATITGTVEATSPARGQWSATFNGNKEFSVNSGITPVQICVLGENVATHMLIGPEAQVDVKVAQLTIKIVPEFN